MLGGVSTKPLHLSPPSLGRSILTDFFMASQASLGPSSVSYMFFSSSLFFNRLFIYLFLLTGLPQKTAAHPLQFP